MPNTSRRIERSGGFVFTKWTKKASFFVKMAKNILQF